MYSSSWRDSFDVRALRKLSPHSYSGSSSTTSSSTKPSTRPITCTVGVSVLAAASTREAAGSGLVWRTLDVVRVKGKERPVEVSELLGRASEIGSPAREVAARYEEGLDLFRRRHFERAAENLGALLRDTSGDPAAERLLGRARAYMADPPPDDWDGVSNFFEK